MKTLEFENLVSALAEDTFDSLIGGTYLFYGVDGHTFKLGNSIYEAVEDADDGYRSYLGSIEMMDTSKCTFQRYPFAVVRIEHCDNSDDLNNYFQGYRFVDIKTKHCWLEIGTDHADDYYPFFVFDYNVDTNQTTVI